MDRPISGLSYAEMPIIVSAMNPPANPKIYHIVHIDRLANIVASGGLSSDALVRANGCVGTTIGMGDLKAARLARAVPPHPGTHVGDYVPFYFCSRSVMLYVIYMANHPALAYRGGQGPIVHLEADLYQVLDWADANGRPWAFSLGNATAVFTEFRASRDHLGELRWDLIPQGQFTDPQVKEAKQSELLVRDFFPWTLVERIGAQSDAVANQAAQLVAAAQHRPTVQRVQQWYY
jgi:hypothetical protein